ncbi:hypothetical protein [Vibrio neptunius]|uniref:Uncharacterized protein n=1 Tax=Vibrio neptunius TaxID=170651 RepID=A0ABS3A212_9VIBR|nr:hypothetical protein [Vibrio neptunius]MBN3492598.1 hypothetical protein [Vibrio neptunius]MBN3515095.1 hypothetical protein [Vibrio neptunius]MBN3548645.1 hypothetical protein [Vibrio neptunius]MBN3577223.1 hypothetical protein [Vibrio neptunius]MCH9870888.1 hypothetical protein [Vibrio neptunius]
MTEPTIEQVNQILTQNNLATVRLITPSFELYDVIHSIVDDSNFSEETNFERLRVLIKAGILKERDVLEHYNNKVEYMDLSYECCPLVKILAPLDRDGTLYLSDSETIYQLSQDFYLDYIKNIILLGGRVDHDEFLCRVFYAEHLSFETFNYLIDRFDFKPSSINTAAGYLVKRRYFKKYDEEAQGRAAFAKLIDKGIDINYPFEEDDGFYEYLSFLGLVFCYDPDLFEQYLLQKPSQHIIAGLPWEFAIEEEFFGDRQLQLVQKLIELGYQLPLDEIIELLEEEELDDYAKALAH